MTPDAIHVNRNCDEPGSARRGHDPGAPSRLRDDVGLVDQLQLASEELGGALAETEEGTPAGTTRLAREKRPAAERNLGRLPARLPRVEQAIERGSIERPCGCGEADRVGEDRTERLDIVPAPLRVVVTERPM